MRKVAGQTTPTGFEISISGYLKMATIMATEDGDFLVDIDDREHGVHIPVSRETVSVTAMKVAAKALYDQAVKDGIESKELISSDFLKGINIFAMDPPITGSVSSTLAGMSDDDD
jgi:hypothetical protein